MKDIKEYLNQQEKVIRELLNNVEGRLKKSEPIKSVICYSKRKTGYQYYLVDEKGKRKYIRKSNLNIVNQKYQREYDLKVKKALQREDALIRNFIKQYDYPAVKNVYENMGTAKQQMVKPIYLPDEEYIAEWKNQFKGDINSYPLETAYITDNNEYVRSKSEKILADLFKRLGIPYYYEPKLKISKEKKLYPDFALLNVKKRKTIYWEHFGLADEGEYATKALKKLDLYEKSGIYVGRDILFSVESSDNPLDAKQIERKLREFVV